MKFILFFIILFSSIGSHIQAQTFEDYYTIDKEWLIQERSVSGSLELIITPENFLFLDLQTSTVFIFDKQMNLMHSFGRSGRGPGEFERPSDIYVDEGNNIYVTDISLRRLTKFNFHGEVIYTTALEGLAIDMVVVDDKVCVHSGAINPRERKIIDCYDKDTGKHLNNFLEVSDVVKGKAVSYSNLVFQTIHALDSKIITLNHSLDGIITVIDLEGSKLSSFVIKNEIFEQPDIPALYNPVQHKIEDYTQSMVISFFVYEDVVVALLTKFGESRYLDFYDLNGKRLVESVVDIGKKYPIYLDESGQLYMITYTDDKENLKLMRYNLVKTFNEEND